MQAGNRDIVTHSYGENVLYYIKVNGYKREVGSLDVSDCEYYLLNIKEWIGGTSTGAKQKFIV